MGLNTTIYVYQHLVVVSCLIFKAFRRLRRYKLSGYLKQCSCFKSANSRKLIHCPLKLTAVTACFFMFTFLILPVTATGRPDILRDGVWHIPHC